jgi:3-hydroxyisobutyrate dehydrogenase-like beta-hydroxyacid dehydrogenase
VVAAADPAVPVGSGEQRVGLGAFQEWHDGPVEARRGLDRAAITDVVSRVAGGRAKRRRLAQALLGRPVVLADGRSPAPRVVGDLLIALRKAGADSVSPPVCATCGKRLRTLQRRGED